MDGAGERGGLHVGVERYGTKLIAGSASSAVEKGDWTLEFCALIGPRGVSKGLSCGKMCFEIDVWMRVNVGRWVIYISVLLCIWISSDHR